MFHPPVRRWARSLLEHIRILLFQCINMLQQVSLLCSGSRIRGSRRSGGCYISSGQSSRSNISFSHQNQERTATLLYRSPSLSTAKHQLGIKALKKIRVLSIAISSVSTPMSIAIRRQRSVRRRPEARFSTLNRRFTLISQDRPRGKSAQTAMIMQ